MEDKVIYAVYAYLLCVFWLTIYLFGQNVLAAIMASIFGGFALRSYGSVCQSLLAQWDAKQQRKMSIWLMNMFKSSVRPFK